MCIDFVVMTCIVGLICIRTEGVNYSSVYILGRKLNSMQNCKSIVTMVLECYFFTLISSFIVHVYVGMACIGMYC